MCNQKPNAAYIQAGYSDIADYFGSLLTLHNLSKGSFIERKAILKSNVVEVYLSIQLDSNLSKAERIYTEILTKK